MAYKAEPQIQAVVRRVVAQMIRAAGAESLADKLEAGDPYAVGDLQPLIEEANKTWEREYKIIAINDQNMYWGIKATMEEIEGDGPIVRLHWGWDDDGPPRVSTPGEYAIDLAEEILEFFTNEDGEVVRPERPESPQSPIISKFFEDFGKVADEYMEVTGNFGTCSLLDVSLWNQMGKPADVPEHEWVDYPEDQVQICAACNQWYSTDPDHDDFPTRVCPGQPLEDSRLQTTDKFDPRRSPALREAQRLDKLIHYMKAGGATQKELEPKLGELAAQKNQLTQEELKRYDKERVGL